MSSTTAAATKPIEDTKQAIKSLEEDDEFEDFPEDHWEADKSLGAAQQERLWDESWDDDDNDDDFTKKLSEELKNNKH